MRVFFTEKAQCLHDHHHTVEQWRFKNLMGGRNTFRLYQKHPGVLDLSAWEEGGGLSGAKLQKAWKIHESQKAAMEQVQGVLELVVAQQSTEPVSGRVNLGEGRVFELPRETEPMVIACSELLTHYDQRGGLIEHALQTLGLEDPGAKLLLN
jgi:hypothetical protein